MTVAPEQESVDGFLAKQIQQQVAAIAAASVVGAVGGGAYAPIQDQLLEWKPWVYILPFDEPTPVHDVGYINRKQFEAWMNNRAMYAAQAAMAYGPCKVEIDAEIGDEPGKLMLNISVTPEVRNLFVIEHSIVPILEIPMPGSRAEQASQAPQNVAIDEALPPEKLG